MKDLKENCYKGTRILLGNEKRQLINKMIDVLLAENFLEISIPIIQMQDIFSNKIGIENKQMMFKVIDGNPERNLCLAPEYTAVVQQLSKTTFKFQKDIKVFYIQECFRGEKPQAGRYRQFTQLGVEILNPSQKYDLSKLALDLLTPFGLENFELITDTQRGLDYYKAGKGFEIACNELGAQKQVCGGGEYEGGVGFAFGIDRLLLFLSNNEG